ncbi:hypothetical protein ETH_00000180 [Eimeria tenella]|uniref:subtilisin n=1 Tax=Eimeria tenella TaxID=5802 RepID=U6L1P2_EIMTE|nr:hypothetical protein ETH_00000180 [Eimeria tenella]CDJ42499.1 hypothetical protein ETH_00000180 [Eimeria tenella]|eukprot:XP_013233249.1 hypothetical protein ETH_00000180 [Eimeria tenella]
MVESTSSSNSSSNSRSSSSSRGVFQKISLQEMRGTRRPPRQSLLLLFSAAAAALLNLHYPLHGSSSDDSVAAAGLPHFLPVVAGDNLRGSDSESSANKSSSNSGNGSSSSGSSSIGSPAGGDSPADSPPATPAADEGATGAAAAAEAPAAAVTEAPAGAAESGAAEVAAAESGAAEAGVAEATGEKAGAAEAAEVGTAEAAEAGAVAEAGAAAEAEEVDEAKESAGGSSESLELEALSGSLAAAAGSATTAAAARAAAAAASEAGAPSATALESGDSAGTAAGSPSPAAAATVAAVEPAPAGPSPGSLAAAEAAAAARPLPAAAATPASPSPASPSPSPSSAEAEGSAGGASAAPSSPPPSSAAAAAAAPPPPRLPPQQQEAAAAAAEAEEPVPCLVRRPYSERRGGYLKVPQSFLDRRKEEALTEAELERQIDRLFAVDPEQIERQSAAIARSVDAARNRGQPNGRIIIGVADLQSGDKDFDLLLQRRSESSSGSSTSSGRDGRSISTRAEAEAMGKAAINAEELQQQQLVGDVKVLPEVGLVVVDFSPESSEAQIRETVKRIWLRSPATWLIEADSEVKIRGLDEEPAAPAAAAAASNTAADETRTSRGPFRVDRWSRRMLMAAEELYANPSIGSSSPSSGSSSDSSPSSLSGPSSSSKTKQQQQQQQRVDKATARKQKQQDIKALQADTKAATKKERSSSTSKQQQQQQTRSPKAKPVKETPQQKQHKLKAQQQQDKSSSDKQAQQQQRTRSPKQQKSTKLKAQQREEDSRPSPSADALPSSAAALSPEPLKEAYLQQLQLPKAVVATPEQMNFGGNVRRLDAAAATEEAEAAAAGKTGLPEAAAAAAGMDAPETAAAAAASMEEVAATAASEKEEELFFPFPRAAAAAAAAAAAEEEENEELLEQREAFLASEEATPNDILFSRQWALHNRTLGCRMTEAWRLVYRRRQRQREAAAAAAAADPAAHPSAARSSPEPITVAVIDTGVDYTHEDLKGRLWKNTGEIPNNGIDDDGNGYVDDYHGYDFERGSADPMDEHGHGTHLVAAVDISDSACAVYRGNFCRLPQQQQQQRPEHQAAAAAAAAEGALPKCLSADIGRLPLSFFQLLRGPLWLLAPPCQPFARRGLKADCGDLRCSSLLQLLQVLQQLPAEAAPRFLLLENVAGFERSNACELLLQTLIDKLNYETVFLLLLNPIHFGLPNCRSRCFLLARRAHPSDGQYARWLRDAAPYTAAAAPAAAAAAPGAAAAAAAGSSRRPVPLDRIPGLYSSQAFYCCPIWPLEAFLEHSLPPRSSSSTCCSSSTCSSSSSVCEWRSLSEEHPSAFAPSPDAAGEENPQQLQQLQQQDQQLQQQEQQQQQRLSALELSAEQKRKSWHMVDLVSRSSTRSSCFTRNYGRSCLAQYGSILLLDNPRELLQQQQQQQKRTVELHDLLPSSTRCRFFSVREQLNLHGFPSWFSIAAPLKDQQQQQQKQQQQEQQQQEQQQQLSEDKLQHRRMIGDSLNVYLVGMLIDFLIGDDPL